MIKKLSRCMVVVALALLTTSYAKANPLPNPFIEDCGSVSAPTGVNPVISSFSPGNPITCAAFVVPSGDTLTSVEMLIENSFSQGVPFQTNTIQFVYLGTGFDAVTGLTTTSTSNASMASAGAATDAGGVTSEVPGSTCSETSAATVACFEITPVPTSFTVTANSSWITSGPSTTSGGSVGVGIDAIFTYVPTAVPPAPSPEPSALTLLGSALLGLMAMTWRYKRLA